MKRRILSLLLCLVLWAGVMPLRALAAADTPDHLALGDSISTGHGLATPASEGFTYRVAAELGYDLTNAAADGSTAADILALLRGGGLDGAIADAELITITCGGNDLMGALYAGIAEEYNATYDTAYTGDDVLSAFAGTHESLTAETFLVTAMGVISTFAESEAFLTALADYERDMNGEGGVMAYIRGINSSAQVILTTQYNPYRLFTGIYKIVSSGIGAGAQELNAVIKANAAASGYTVADVHGAFEASGEDLCNPTMEPLDLDFHPNAAGHRVIADTVIDAIRANCGHEDGAEVCAYCGQTLRAVTVTATPGGMAGADRTVAAAGDVVLLGAAADAGCRFVRWETVSGEVTVYHPESTITGFVMPDTPVEIRAVFEVCPLTVEADGGYTYENGVLEITEAGSYVIANTDPTAVAAETIRVSAPGALVTLAGVNGPTLETVDATTVVVADGTENALRGAALAGGVITCENDGHVCGESCGSLTLAALEGGTVSGGNVTVTGTLGGAVAISGGMFAADGTLLAAGASISVSPRSGERITVQTGAGTAVEGSPFADETDITALVGGQGWFACFVHVHSNSAPVFTWASDHTCTATYACAACGEGWTVDCDVTAETTEATCAAEGRIVYTASVTVGGEVYTDTVTEVIGREPHDEDLVNWIPGTDTHWHGCANCDTRLDEMPHIGGKASCAAQALCDVCGGAYGATDPTAHGDNTELRDAAEAEEFRDGYTGDTWCLDCGTKIAGGEIIPATHIHSYGQWVVTKEATADAEGSREKTCACGEKIVEPIPKLPLDNVPATGDGVLLWLGVVGLSVTAIAVLAWTPKRRS